MSELSKVIRCKECKQEVVGELRDHWAENHEEKLREIDKWLGKCDDKLWEWERVVKRQEKGEGKDENNKG